MSQLTDELSNFYGTNENAWKNVQWHFAAHSAYLITRATVKDVMYVVRNTGGASLDQSAARRIDNDAHENVQGDFEAQSEYLLDKAMAKDGVYAINNPDFPPNNSSEQLASARNAIAQSELPPPNQNAEQLASARNAQEQTKQQLDNFGALALTGKRIAWAQAELLSVQNMFRAEQRAKEIKLLKKKKEERENRIKIIEDKRAKRERTFGEIVMNDQGKKFFAKDGLGRKVIESLIIYYEGEESFQFTKQTLNPDGTEGDKEQYTTKIIALADLSPRISIQSGKNLILTTVQGRDYTRKELVSGGDLSFSVSGVIVSPILTDYPTNDVKKFINIMEYGGIVNVNNMIFDQFNVNRILIKDWHLEAQECKNIQPYSFTCVAVEPDTDVVIESDTIDLIDYQIGESGVDGVVSVMLNKKWANRAAGFDFNLADLLEQII